MFDELKDCTAELKKSSFLKVTFAQQLVQSYQKVTYFEKSN